MRSLGLRKLPTPSREEQGKPSILASGDSGSVKAAALSLHLLFLPLLLQLLSLAAGLSSVPGLRESSHFLWAPGRGILTTLAPRGDSFWQPPCPSGHPSTVSTHCLSPGSSEGASWPSVLFLLYRWRPGLMAPLHGRFRRPRGEAAPWVSFSRDMCPECLAHTSVCPRSCEQVSTGSRGEPP